MVFNPFIWTVDQLLIFGLVPPDLGDQFLKLNISLKGVTGANLEANFTKNPVFGNSVALDGLQSLHVDS